MKYSNLYLIGLVFTLITTNNIAQDPAFHQNDNALIFNNPAFTGTNKSSSFDLTYRNQWPNLSGNYETTALSANQYLGKGNGISLLYVNENAAQFIKTNTIGIGYAKQITIKKNHHLSIGLQAIYFNKNTDWDKLIYRSLIGPRQGFTYHTISTNFKTDIRSLDFNTGFLYHNEHFFIGTALHHLFEPNIGFIEELPLPKKINFQLGGKIKFNEITFIPYFQSIYQKSFHNSIASIKTRFKFIELNIGYALQDGPLSGLGLRFDIWNIGYNYSYTNSRLSDGKTYMHEIRVGFQPNLFNKTNENYFNF